MKNELSKPAVQRLEAWMREVTEVLSYQPEIPLAHKTILHDALHAFSQELEAPSAHGTESR